MTTKQKARHQNGAGKENSHDDCITETMFSIAERLRFSRPRRSNKEFRRFIKFLVSECFDAGLISPAGAEYIIQRGGLRHA